MLVHREDGYAPDIDSCVTDECMDSVNGNFVQRISSFLVLAGNMLCFVWAWLCQPSEDSCKDYGGLDKRIVWFTVYDTSSNLGAIIIADAQIACSVG